MNKENLIPFNAMPEERHRELSRKGGLHSAAVRREKRERIEAAKAEKKAESELWQESLSLICKTMRLLSQATNK